MVKFLISTLSLCLAGSVLAGDKTPANSTTWGPTNRAEAAGRVERVAPRRHWRIIIDTRKADENDLRAVLAAADKGALKREGQSRKDGRWIGFTVTHREAFYEIFNESIDAQLEKISKMKGVFAVNPSRH